jgi:membrane-bound metal-dependent hydrolase YbcI (DUF457 family)
MFVGHFSATFVAKRLEPRLPLWSLLLAVQLVDVVWVLFILVGIEQATIDFSLPGNPLVLSYMPYTHSLPATFLWSVLVGLLCIAIWSGGQRKLALALTLGLTVASHWLLDLLVHRHDLALWGNSHKVGLGLWNLPLLSYGLEVVLLVGSALFLARAKSWAGERNRALACLCLGLLVLQTASQFGTAPHNLQVMVVSALVVFLLVPLAGRWVEQAGR